MHPLVGTIGLCVCALTLVSAGRVGPATVTRASGGSIQTVHVLTSFNETLVMLNKGDL